MGALHVNNDNVPFKDPGPCYHSSRHIYAFHAALAAKGERERLSEGARHVREGIHSRRAALLCNLQGKFVLGASCMQKS